MAEDTGSAETRSLARQLDAVLAPLGYHCLHGVDHVGDNPIAVDHVLVGPGGVFVVSEEHLAHEVRAGTDGRVWCGGQSLEAGLDYVLELAGAVGSAIGSPATGVMAIHGAEVKAPSVVRTVHLSQARNVPLLIKRRGSYRTAAQVELAAARARARLSARAWTAPASPTSDPRPVGSHQRSGPIGRLLRRGGRRS
ncbi:MAG TPA: nuclease-related domain-containing protein [Acidimicrobiales bacterium]|nr:nuclease-related domain-containing protein [Acidimicrobiales bacterium]